MHAATRDHLLRDLCICVVHALDRHSSGINQTRHAHTHTDREIVAHIWLMAAIVVNLPQNRRENADIILLRPALAVVAVVAVNTP